MSVAKLNTATHWVAPSPRDVDFVYSAEDLCSSPGKRGVFPFSRSTMYRLIASGKFPPGEMISDGRRGWRRKIIQEYQGKGTV
jgi:hypothetical protein